MAVKLKKNIFGCAKFNPHTGKKKKKKSVKMMFPLLTPPPLYTPSAMSIVLKLCLKF